mmetsp:Transcript_12568/g.22592  ORF Transcript_12568/g.22592 Transcript_12568/m.22592 type:complete len:873 (+) Transcript_12568:147-2765(+)
MQTTVMSMSLADTVELLDWAWFEIVMASFAAFVYVVLSGWLFGKKGTSKRHAAKDPEKTKVPPELQSATKALRQGKVTEAIAFINEMLDTTAGCVPMQIAPRLLLAMAKAKMTEASVEQLKVFSGKIDVAALEVVLKDLIKQMDVAACRRLHKLADVLMIPKTELVFEALAKAYSSDANSLRQLVAEAGAPLKKAFAKVVLEACATSKDVELASEIFEKIDSADAAALRAIAEKAAAAALSSTKEDSHSPGDDSSKARAIRSFAKSKNLQGAVDMFERLRRSTASTLLFNSILDTCVECGDIKKALEYFTQAKDEGMADTVSYNTLMKGHLLRGEEEAARRLLKEISDKGMIATHASYHALLNARALARDRQGVWQMVKDMQANSVVPNAVTCSILLKGTVTQSAGDVAQVLSLVDAMQEPMDEVLFSSVAEACIRARRLDLLSKQIKKYVGRAALSAPTYGSMIKAYGQARNVKCVRDLWEEMTRQGVKPTAVTLGCMVEALVANGCTPEAWQLAQKLWNDDDTRPLVNTVIYSTILKGFATAKDPAKVMVLYDEMKSRGVQPNTVTYNTILNAFAQSGSMHRVPALLEDMKSVVPPVEWDLVTYSTIIKGFCSSGNLDRGLDILREMKADGKCSPDEVMYNSLLDGCAKEHRLDDALKLLEDMKASGVAPSNYTLSMLVKLMGRCRRLAQAFSLVETLSQEHGVKVNIQVYTCLIQACFNNRQVGKAISVHDRILKEGLRPDEMTYSVLVRGCLHANAIEQAVTMVRQAYMLEGARTTFKGSEAPPGVDSRCLKELVDRLGQKGGKQGQSLLAEINTSRHRNSATRGRQTGGSFKSSADGETAPPWRQQGRALSSSTASTESGSSCSESD